MLAEMFNQQTGANIQIVPYKGASTLITDMMAGRIQVGFETTSVMLSHLHQGDIRGLAVLRDQRIAELPDVPTMVESGVNGVIGSSWSGMLAPAGTPQPILDKLRADVLAALKTPEFSGKLKMMAADVPSMTAAEFGSFIASEADADRQDHEGGRVEGAMKARRRSSSAALAALGSAAGRWRRTRRPGRRSRFMPACTRPPPRATSPRSKS